MRVLSSNMLVDFCGVIKAILFKMLSNIWTQKKLPIYLSAGTIFSRKVTWRIMFLSWSASSKLFMMMLIRRWSLLTSSMQLCLILLSSTTKVRTSTEESEPSVNRKKSCTRALPTFYSIISLVILGCCSHGLKIILKFVTITLPWRDGTLRKLCSHVMLLTMRYFSSPISTSCSRRP